MPIRTKSKPVCSISKKVCNFAPATDADVALVEQVGRTMLI